MNNKLTVILLSLASASAMAHDSYNFDFQYQHHNNKYQSNPDAASLVTLKQETNNWKLAYYFNDVDTSQGPLQQAAFINRASSISMTANTDEDHVSLDYYGKNFDFYAKAEYSDYSGNKFHLGWMLDDHWLVAITSAQGSSEQKMGIYGKRLFSLPDEQALVVKMGYDGAAYTPLYGDDIRQYYLEADFYLDRGISIGFSYSDNESSDHHKHSFNAYEARVNAHIFDNLSLGFSFAGTNASEVNPGMYLAYPNMEVDHSYTVSANLRF